MQLPFDQSSVPKTFFFSPNTDPHFSASDSRAMTSEAPQWWRGLLRQPGEVDARGSGYLPQAEDPGVGRLPIIAKAWV